MVSDRGLEEEGEITEDGSEGLLVDLNSGEELGKEHKIKHDGGGEE